MTSFQNCEWPTCLETGKCSAGCDRPQLPTDGEPQPARVGGDEA